MGFSNLSQPHTFMSQEFVLSFWTTTAVDHIWIAFVSPGVHWVPHPPSPREQVPGSLRAGESFGGSSSHFVRVRMGRPRKTVGFTVSGRLTGSLEAGHPSIMTTADSHSHVPCGHSVARVLGGLLCSTLETLMHAWLTLSSNKPSPSGPPPRPPLG